jgi:hypothetical protein
MVDREPVPVIELVAHQQGKLSEERAEAVRTDPPQVHRPTLAAPGCAAGHTALPLRGSSATQTTRPWQISQIRVPANSPAQFPSQRLPADLAASTVRVVLCLGVPARRFLAGSMWCLADGQHGSEQVVQRSRQVMLGDEGNLVIDAKMVDRPSRNRRGRAAGRPGHVRGDPPMGRCRWTRRCQPSGAAWCRLGRSGSRRPSSAQFVPSGRISAGTSRRWRPMGTPGRLHALLTVESVTVHALNPVTSAADLAQRSSEGLPRMTQRHEQPVANGQPKRK